MGGVLFIYLVCCSQLSGATNLKSVYVNYLYKINLCSIYRENCLHGQSMVVKDGIQAVYISMALLDCYYGGVLVRQRHCQIDE